MIQGARLHVLVFLGVAILSLGGLVAAFVAKNTQITQSEREIRQRQEVISRTQQMEVLVYRTLSLQRGYLLSGDRDLLAEYDLNKKNLTETLATLQVLTKDNPAQSSRMTELQHHYLAFTEILDAMMQKYKTDKNLGSLREMSRVAEIRKSFDRVTETILKEEYGLLGNRIHKLNDARKALYRNLGISIFLAILILTVLNAYLMLIQNGSDISGSLKEAEERLRLAIRGTNDGIYDWNLLTHEIYWSPQFKGLIGYQDDEIEASPAMLESLMHPEDRQQARDTTYRYLNRELSELSCIFRLRHKAGHWIWVQKRGKALFDEDGKAIRLTGTYSDVSRLKEYEVRLEEAKDLAEKANAAKTEFLAHMSHEIRTPLTSISGVSEILMNQKKDFSTKHQQLIKVLSYSTINLKELINDILDFSKIESGQMELEEKPFLLKDLFQEIISTMSVRAQEKGLSFSFDYRDVEDVKFLGDKIRLRQILMNLVGNALKFTHEGSVSVRAASKDVEGAPMMEIEVKDTGIGIDSKNFELIFERFRQADPSVSRKYGGTGLGLAISRSLIESMGGKIILKSVVEKGSTFTILLPLRVVTAQTEQDQIVQKGNIHQLKVGREGSSRVLLVEDYEGNIAVLTYILESLGCHLEVARTGLQAINLWKEKAPDLILMDVQMPEMDGLTATRQIRKIEREQGLPRTPIIGMTAHAFVEDKDKCAEAGMDSYLAKPIAESDLVAEISKYIDEKEARLERQASKAKD